MTIYFDQINLIVDKYIVESEIINIFEEIFSIKIVSIENLIVNYAGFITTSYHCESKVTNFFVELNKSLIYRMDLKDLEKLIVISKRFSTHIYVDIGEKRDEWLRGSPDGSFRIVENLEVNGSISYDLQSQSYGET